MPIRDWPTEGSDDLVILSQVSPVAFTATPETIGPFGVSVLSWEVDGPDSGFQVRLNRRAVPRSGSLAVQPQFTRSFTLSARAGAYRKKLGYVTVSVDLGACDPFYLTNVDGRVSAALENHIENDAELYPQVPGPPVIVTVTPGRIKFKLAVKQRLNNRPDPSVDIEAQFGLEVVEGALTSADEQIETDVRVPWYTWLAPGAIIWLPMLIANGRQEAAEAARRAIQGIVSMFNFLGAPQEGWKTHSVQIEVYESGDAELIITHCPDDLIRAIAFGSEVIQRRPG